MNVKQLRDEANLRGLSAVGTKKELLERLCEYADKNSLDEVVREEQEKKGSSKEEKIVTGTKKGAAVLDQGIPDQIKAHYPVLQQGDHIYDAMLNQTNVGHNNNKFYVIQRLESDDYKTYTVYNRWGRVGVKGQTKLHGPFTSQQAAIAKFESKFFNKTNNYWSNRKDFLCYLSAITGWRWTTMKMKSIQIAKYAQNTHAKTHSNYTVDIVQNFKVASEGETKRFEKFSGTKNRMLLWHGSQLTNWTGILSQGSRICSATGYKFGKGVYFADMFSKSANYCYASSAFTTEVLLFCEVALGDMAELLQAKSNADKLPDGKLRLG